MKDFLLAGWHYFAFLCAVYTVAFIAGLGWKHSRGSGVTVNVHGYRKEER